MCGPTRRRGADIRDMTRWGSKVRKEWILRLYMRAIFMLNSFDS